MKKIKDGNLVIILIITTFILAISLILIRRNMTTKLNEKEKNAKEEKEELKIEDETNAKKEESITPVYKIYIPSPQKSCSIDNCITEDNYNSINEYLSSKYEIKEQEDHIYVIKDADPIEIVQGKENDSEPIDKVEYKYIINRYTTVEDVKEVFGDKTEVKEDTVTDNSNKVDSKDTNTINNNNNNNKNSTNKNNNNTSNNNKKTAGTNNTKPKETNNKYATEIAVLNYHFFYDKSKESCNESICLDVRNFEGQLQYLKNNNFKTLTMDEFRAWMYGEKELPKKSVLLTIDDGAMGTGSLNGNKLIPLLEKYKMHATLFLITGWWNKENYQSSYLDIQSHGDLIHEYAKCSDGNNKPRLQCLNYDQLKDDFTKSITKVDNNISFCYPFYSYNQTAINVLKELKFKLAFVGGNTKAKRNNNKYLIPRYIIYKTTSLASFKNMVN